MAEQLAPKKVRNYAVDFWRLFCTFGVAMMHFAISSGSGRGEEYGWIAGMFTDGAMAPFQTGGLLIGFFFISSGYFMVASFKSKQRKGLLNGVSAGTQAWQYTASRFKLFYPPILISSLWGLAIIIYTVGLNLKEVFYAFIVNAWELMGLAQLGNTNVLVNGAFNDCINFGSDFANGTSVGVFVQNWNLSFPTWYMSGLIIMGLFLYYLLAKNEDSFKGFWCPIIVVIFCANWGLAEPNMLLFRGEIFMGMFNTHQMWCLGGLAMGAMTYYFVEHLKKLNYNKAGKIFLTVLNAICSIFIIYTSWDSTLARMDTTTIIPNEMYMYPALIIVFICAMINQDYVTKLFNWKGFGALGEFSMYWFVMHHNTITLVAYLSASVLKPFRDNYWAMAASYIIIVTVLGLGCQFICKKLVAPLLDKVIPEKFLMPKPVAPAPAPEAK